MRERRISRFSAITIPQSNLVVYAITILQSNSSLFCGPNNFLHFLSPGQKNVFLQSAQQQPCPILSFKLSQNFMKTIIVFSGPFKLIFLFSLYSKFYLGNGTSEQNSMGAPTTYDMCLAACDLDLTCRAACWAGQKFEVEACPPVFGPFCILGCPAACLPLLPVFQAWALCISGCIGAVQPPPVWACNQGSLHAPPDQLNCDGVELFGVGSNV